jgi:putative membrane protein
MIGVRQHRTRSLIEDCRQVEAENALIELFALQSKSERIENFSYPRPCAPLSSAFTWIFVALLPFGVMFELDEIGSELVGRYPLVRKYFVWSSIPFSVLVIWVVNTMVRMGRVSENAFESTPNDVPIATIARGIEIDLCEMIDQDPSKIPAPIEPQYDTQT